MPRNIDWGYLFLCKAQGLYGKGPLHMGRFGTIKGIGRLGIRTSIERSFNLQT